MLRRLINCRIIIIIIIIIIIPIISWFLNHHPKATRRRDRVYLMFLVCRRMYTSPTNLRNIRCLSVCRDGISNEDVSGRVSSSVRDAAVVAMVIRRIVSGRLL